MPGLLIKDFPPELHLKLKEDAARHHRSMTRQALALLEQALSAPARNAADLLPKPLKPTLPLVPDDVVAILREARDSVAADPPPGAG
jgi:plasmid stability protein